MSSDASRRAGPNSLTLHRPTPLGACAAGLQGCRAAGSPGAAPRRAAPSRDATVTPPQARPPVVSGRLRCFDHNP